MAISNMQKIEVQPCSFQVMHPDKQTHSDRLITIFCNHNEAK